MPQARRNRTLTLSPAERHRFRPELLRLTGPAPAEAIINRVIHQDLFQILPFLPSAFVDLLFLDPPYNLTKTFARNSFHHLPLEQYQHWVLSWLHPLLRTLKPTASIYFCGDWRSSAVLQQICSRFFILRSRITFEREKGRGAKHNWKNTAEDIWFATMSRNYYFNAEAVKLKRRVLAPYRENGQPRGWQPEGEEKFRLTCPSNLWTDISLPFWSMPENTPHPAQKPEKLLAKIILASSRPGDVILDPFAGTGTAGVVAAKLGRRFVLVECEEEYCLYTVKRLKLAEEDPRIQGYEDGVFWERNSRPQKRN